MPPDQPKTGFVLCADDFGISPGVCEGILELLAARRLSAVGCMTPSPVFERYAESLLMYADRCDIGVHLTLTGPDLAAWYSDGVRKEGETVGGLMRRAFTGRLDTDKIRAEFHSQLDRFEAVLHKTPDFVDGHHHVHQLPVIRDCLLQILKQRYPHAMPYLRASTDRIGSVFRRNIAVAKALAIGYFGAGLSRPAVAAGIRVNNGFSGIYDFSATPRYAERFDRFTTDLPANAIVMCHPGHVDSDLCALDIVTDPRELELQFFLSEEFNTLLSRKNLVLAQFDKTLDARS